MGKSLETESVPDKLSLSRLSDNWKKATRIYDTHTFFELPIYSSSNTLAIVQQIDLDLVSSEYLPRQMIK